ncbi:hypothetical protein EDD15DRAFT_2373472 [Pisolithus albus]|nr:hypothetical protein EDD15DRAFT_2373472 [Pisolithus albus]
MHPSQVPSPVPVLSPDLAGVLKNNVEATMVAIIKKNRHTRYFSESPDFAQFHSALRKLERENDTDISDDTLLETYQTTIPLTTYDSYEPFVTKFLAETCQEDDVRDMFSPGLPRFIVVTSSTSKPKPKFYCRYNLPTPLRHVFGDCGQTFWTFSLHYRQLVRVQNRNGDIISTIPAGTASSAGVRMQHGLEVENDHLNIKLAADWATSPVAVGFIRDYRTFMLTHTLFALAHGEVETICILFATSAVDMIRYMEEEWDTLITSIETGELPPGRGSNMSGNTFSGVFSVAVPKLRFYLGPNVQLRSLGFATSEARIATAYDPSDLNLFKATSQDIIEYLDVDKEDTASSIVPPLGSGNIMKSCAPLKTDCGVIALETVVEITGFDRTDGTPIFRYFERRKRLNSLPSSIVRSGVPTLAYLVEVHGELHPEAAKAPMRLHKELCCLNEEFDPQRMQIPTIRVLEPGAFGGYRQWKIETNDSGAGQAKVPVLMWDDAAREWMLARVRRELSVDSSGGVVQGRP